MIPEHPTRSTSEIIAAHLRSRDNSDAGIRSQQSITAVAPRNFGRDWPCLPVLEDRNAEYFRGGVQSAIAACEGRRVSNSPALQ
jgi:hypothetical protein